VGHEYAAKRTTRVRPQGSRNPGNRAPIHGESCRNAIGLPLFLWGGWDLGGWGDAGYRDAVAKAQAQAPGRTLSDVRVDVRFVNVVVWRKECLEVTAAAR
jgi:hypothetical protein